MEKSLYDSARRRWKLRKVFKVTISVQDPVTFKKKFRDFIVDSFSEYFQAIYPVIIAYAPIDKAPVDPRAGKREKGIVAKHIKLMEDSLMGKRYLTIGMPGSKVAGSEANRAALAVQALHYGWANPRTIIGRPTLTFPVTYYSKAGSMRKPPPGAELGKWIAPMYVNQSGRYHKYPWITNTINSTISILYDNFESKFHSYMHKVKYRKESVHD